MTAPIFDRWCIICGCKMELVIRYQTGNEIVRCPKCGHKEEINNSGAAVPQSQPKQERTK
jgi:DNA-directed RNA polymerase subunit M/transcription elongation factor TFIIS